MFPEAENIAAQLRLFKLESEFVRTVPFPEKTLNNSLLKNHSESF